MAQKPEADERMPAMSMRNAIVPNAAVTETKTSEPVRLSPPGMYGLALYLRGQQSGIAILCSGISE